MSVFECLYIQQSGKASYKQRKQLRSLVLGCPYVEKKAEGADQECYRYYNPQSEVEGFWYFYEPETDDELGVALEIPLPRPTFFALELAPLAIGFAREVRCGLDFLWEGEGVLETAPTHELLLHEYSRASYLTYKEGSLDSYWRVNFDIAEELWEYRLLMDYLGRRNRRYNLQVQPGELAVHKKSKKVVRFFEWDGKSLFIAPRGSYIRLQDPPKPFKTGWWYSIDKLNDTEEERSVLKVLSQPMPHFVLEKKGKVAQLLEAMTKTKRVTDRSFTRLRLDQVVDSPALEHWSF